MVNKHKRNVPIAQARDADGDRQGQRDLGVHYWSAAYGITKRRFADAMKAVGTLTAKRRTGSQHD
jgi:hypothetical protein